MTRCSTQVYEWCIGVQHLATLDSTVTYFNQTTGFCGVILATLITVNLPANFGVDTFNNFARTLDPDECVENVGTPAKCL